MAVDYLRTPAFIRTAAALALGSCASVALAGGHSATSNEVVDDVQHLQAYYLAEDADFGKYSRVRLDRLKLDNARVIPPPWYAGDDKAPQKWELTQEDIDWLRKSYRQAVKEQIERDGGYPVTDEFAADVIVMDVEVISLMPYARKGEDVQVKGFGELKVQATLRDGLTGELLGIFEGDQEVGSQYQQNTRLNAENSLTNLFRIWGKRMRYVLDNNR